MCTISLIMGGNARVGLEDNLYLDRGVRAKSNADQVEKIVRISRELGLEPASPDEARQILGLKGLDKVACTDTVIVHRGLRRLCAPGAMEGETISPSKPPPS